MKFTVKPSELKRYDNALLFAVIRLTKENNKILYEISSNEKSDEYRHKVLKAMFSMN
jgi:hypothetical protein